MVEKISNEKDDLDAMLPFCRPRCNCWARENFAAVIEGSVEGFCGAVNLAPSKRQSWKAFEGAGKYEDSKRREESGTSNCVYIASRIKWRKLFGEENGVMKTQVAADLAICIYGK